MFDPHRERLPAAPGATPPQKQAHRPDERNPPPGPPATCGQRWRATLAQHHFAIRTGDELIVKRLALDQKLGWLLESDHPDRTKWPTKPWPDDAAIVGEVRWVGRSLP